MSQQTDELMHYVEQREDAAEKEQLRQQNALELAQAKTKLRLLQELQNVHGFQLFLSYLQSEQRMAFSEMERQDNPLGHTRAVGNYIALTNTIEFVPKQIQELIEQLAGT